MGWNRDLRDRHMANDGLFNSYHCDDPHAKWCWCIELHCMALTQIALVFSVNSSLTVSTFSLSWNAMVFCCMFVVSGFTHFYLAYLGLELLNPEVSVWSVLPDIGFQQCQFVCVPSLWEPSCFNASPELGLSVFLFNRVGTRSWWHQESFLQEDFELVRDMFYSG